MAGTRILATLVAALLLALATAPAFAQMSDQYIGIYYSRKFIEQRQNAAQRTAKPPVQRDAARPPSQPGTYETPPAYNALVLGDNYAEWLAYGLDEAFDDVPELGFTPQVRLGSGAMKTEPVDWPKLAADLLAQTPKVDFIIATLGLNDKEPIQRDGQTHDIRTEAWQEAYLRRLDALLTVLKGRSVPVLFVGLPPVAGARFADHAYLNAMARDRVEAAGLTYVDVWSGFVDDKNEFSLYGPDIVGQHRRLRSADGVYFTRAGARKYALYAEQVLRGLLAGRIGGGLTPSPDTPAVTPAPETPQDAPAPQASLPAEPAPPRERPEAGPIETLTGAGRTPPRAAALLGGGTPRPLAVNHSATSAAPVTGRIDDARWNGLRTLAR